jgi:hypothetical protein
MIVDWNVPEANAAAAKSSKQPLRCGARVKMPI